MPNPSQQIPLPLTSHNNQSLFSDHYLDDILRHTPTWQTAVTQARPLLNWLRARYTQEQAQLTDYKEAQLEENWFKPIFERLGHIYRDYTAHITHLSRRLAATDHLIDQIVYQLYGLTAEEIAIIEA